MPLAALRVSRRHDRQSIRTGMWLVHRGLVSVFAFSHPACPRLLLALWWPLPCSLSAQIVSLVLSVNWLALACSLRCGGPCLASIAMTFNANEGAIVTYPRPEASQWTCCICGQTPDQVPWADFDAENPTIPVNRLCFQDADTCKQRWPCLQKGAIVDKAAADPAFVQQVLHLTKVKLGSAAKHFLPQSVVQDEEVGIRIEEPLVALNSRAFKDHMKTSLGPERFPELTSHPIRRADGSYDNLYLHRDQDAPPKVTLWREHRLSTRELKMPEAGCLESGHGSDLMELITKSFLNTQLPVALPTLDETRQLVQQRPVGPTGPSPSGGSALPRGVANTGADGTIAAAGLGGSSAFLAMEGAAGAVLGGPKAKQPAFNARPRMPGVQARHGEAGHARPALEAPPVPKRGRRAGNHASAGRAAEISLPSIADCLEGKSHYQGRTLLQVLYQWKVQVDGKFARREIEQTEHLRWVADHRLRIFALGLSRASVEKATMSDINKCLAGCLAWDGMLPPDVFVTVFGRKISFVWEKPVPVQAKIKEIAGIADPAVLSHQVPPGQQGFATETLGHVPAEKLSESQRWRVVRELWMESLLPRILPTLPPDSEPLHSAFATLAAACGAVSNEDANILSDICAVLGCHRQATPMQVSHVTLLQGLFCPEEAKAHIQVLAAVLSADWLRVLRSAMSFSIAEAQAAPELQQAVEAMRTGEAAGAWQLLLSKWPVWQQKVRPVVLSNAAAAALANVKRRVADLESGDAAQPAAEEEGKTLISLSTAFAQLAPDGDKAEWAVASEQAKAALRAATASSRWDGLLRSLRGLNTISSPPNPGSAADGGESQWKVAIAEASTQAKACEGLDCPEADHDAMHTAIRNAFAADTLSEEALRLTDIC